jgi:hypothetical protein
VAGPLWAADEGSSFRWPGVEERVCQLLRGAAGRCLPLTRTGEVQNKRQDGLTGSDQAARSESRYEQARNMMCARSGGA